MASNDHLSQALLPDGTMVKQVGTTMKKWCDDFGLNSAGQNAVDTAINWDVYDGGTYDATIAVNTKTNGSGVSLLSGVSVANSTLLVNMGTTANAEVHLLSKEVFTNPLDVYVSLKLSQAIVNNSVYVELVEVDPATLKPLAHASINDARNRCGALLGGASATTVFLECVSDDSPNGVNNTTTASFLSWLADTDLQLEFRPADTWLTGVATDNTGARTGSSLRLSKQVPDPNRLYKLRLRFKNGGVAPASATTVTVYRALVCDVQEVQIEIAGGRGDAVAGKAVPVVVQSLPALATGSAKIGGVEGMSSTTGNGLTQHRLVSAATTNATLLKAAGGKIVTGSLINTSAAVKYVKFFAKVTAPVPGTDAVFFTVQIPPTSEVHLADLWDLYGLVIPTGMGYAITALAADLDATAVAAGDVIVQIGWV